MRKRGPSRFVGRLFAAFAPLALLTIACNAILGNEERFVDERGNTRDVRQPPTDTGGGGSTDAKDDEVLGLPDAEAGVDGGPTPVTIVVPNSWTTRNQAQFTLVDGGVNIFNFTAPAGHPAIVPDPMPNIPGDNYTVEAVIRAPSNGEWGVMVRVAANGAGALVGSKFGGEQRPFTGNMGPPDFSPTQQNLGPVYVYTPGARYRMRLKVEGTQTFGKMWEVGQAEPGGFQVLGTATNATTRGVGYYVYNTFDTVLESMTITVP